jgi:hypothetical protein
MKTSFHTGNVLSAVLSMLMILAAGCQKPSMPMQESDPAALLSATLSQLRETQQDTQLLFLEQIRPTKKPSDLFAAVIRTGEDQRIVILEPALHVSGESASPKAGAYHIAIDAVVLGDPSAYLDPEGFDADGDGTPEVFFRLVDYFADRSNVSFLLFSKSSGAWKVFGSPVLQPDPEFKKAILFGGQTHYIDVQDMGNWIVLHRSDGVKFISIEVVREGQCTMCPYRYRAVVYQFTPDGFEQDPSWNGGKPFVCEKPIYGPDRSTIELWVENGYKKKQ